MQRRAETFFLSVFAAAIALCLCSITTSSATEQSALYRSAAIVTGQELPNRVAAAKAALPRVLIKLSGDPSIANDARIAPYIKRAIDLVSAFTYRDQMAGVPVRDEQGTRDRPYDLTLQFDPAKIDDLLRKLDRKQWSGARPTIAVFVSFNHTRRYTVTRDDPSSLGPREALASASERAGLDIAIPMSYQARESFADTVPLNAPLESKAKLAAALTPSATEHPVLTGHAVWDDDQLGWRTTWQLDARGKTIRWTVDQVTYDEAFRNGLIGTAQILSSHGTPSGVSGGKNSR